MAEVVWSGWILTRPPTPEKQAPKQVIPMAGLSLESQKKELKAGESLDVDIVLSTGNRQTIGTDVILHFDPKMLEVLTATGSASPVRAGSLYQDYPANQLEPSGRISFSGTSLSQAFAGRGVLGSVTFKAVRSGTTTVKIDYQSGSSTDSNVTESNTARDILISVQNLELSIKP